jgi:CheY-like chemotaxis protein
VDPDQTTAPLQGLRILIVEDDVLLAMELERILRGEGCSILGPAPKQAKALALLERDRPDAAVMDLNLSGERPIALAEALVRLKVPLVIVSGYSENQSEDPVFSGARRLSCKSMDLIGQTSLIGGGLSD